MNDFIYEWQGLIGSLLGAATPISLWFLTEWHRKRSERKKHLYNLEKFLVYSINNAIDAYNTINHFIEKRLSKLIEHVKENNNNGAYSVDNAYFPLFSVYPINENVLDVDTESGYIDNKIIQIMKLSKDFALSIDDLRRQFTDTMKINRSMAFNRLNPSHIHNETYIRNLEEFKTIVKQDMLEKNVKIYIKILVNARVGVNTLRDIGVNHWRFKFSPSFKYFKDQRELKKFKDSTFERIDQFLEEKINAQLEEIGQNSKIIFNIS